MATFVKPHGRGYWMYKGTKMHDSLYPTNKQTKTKQSKTEQNLNTLEAKNISKQTNKQINKQTNKTDAPCHAYSCRSLRKGLN